jgi:hypothetical protein
MSMSAEPDDSHEFVVAPELAEVAERLGVPLHAGDRVRFEVVDGGDQVTEGGPASRRSWPPAWIDSINTGETDLGVRAREVLRAEFSQQ